MATWKKDSESDLEISLYSTKSQRSIRWVQKLFMISEYIFLINKYKYLVFNHQLCCQYEYK